MKESVPRTAAERFRRHRRDLEAFRRRSLFRRSQARFRRDLAVVPHVFLLPGRVSGASLLAGAEEVRLAFRGRAVWTLDTAARLVCGWGILSAGDLTGYLEEEDLEWARDRGLIGPRQTAGLTLDPLHRRPPMLVAHRPAEPPPALELPSGESVVPWGLLIRDLLGTLGWRPDLLDRIEEAYREGTAGLPERR